MGEQRHTPGPWVAICEDVSQKYRPVGDDGVRYWTIQQEWKDGDAYRGGVADVHAAEHINGITIAERDANAHLIAAAPDMFEALKKSAEGWANAIELGLIPPQHIRSAEILRDEARAALSKAQGY